ncbi:hypothetical protein ABN034_21430 [Actinopolymorpha sp. B11F2]|uniref:hypothetical protein n=1 Tax=Actinopolymorpha sp. B11F2 TaxID=3160862 RepID=UPI0032E49091
MTVYYDWRALEEYAEVLEAYDRDVDFIKDYLNRYVFSESGLVTHEPTLWHASRMLQDVARSQTLTRLSHMSRLGEGSSKGLHSAAKFYKQTEREQAEVLERTYDTEDLLPGPPTNHANEDEPYQRFFVSSISYDVLRLERKDRGDDLGIHLHKLQEEIGWWADLPSPTAWARKFCKWATSDWPGGGIDPVEELVKFFWADWDAWIEATKAWRRVGAAVEAMRHDQLMQYLHLEDYWNGKAHAAAVAYFRDFAAAHKVEEDYYDYMFKSYRAYAEFVFAYGQLVLDAATLCIDTIITMGVATAARAAAGGAPAVLSKIWSVIEKFALFLTAIKQDVESFGAGQGDAPPCKLAAIRAPYDHPEKDW